MASRRSGPQESLLCDFSLAITNLVTMSDMELHPEANQRKFVHEVFGGVGQRGSAGHLPNADANSAAALNAPRKSLPLYDFGFMPLLIIVN